MAEQQHELVIEVTRTDEKIHFTYRTSDSARLESITTLFLNCNFGLIGGSNIAVAGAADAAAPEPLDVAAAEPLAPANPAAAVAGPAVPEGAAPAAAAAAAAPEPEPEPAAAALGTQGAVPVPVHQAAVPAALTRAQVEELARLTYDDRILQTDQPGISCATNRRTPNGEISRGAGWLCDDDTWYQAKETKLVYNTLTDIAPYRCRGEGCGRRHWEVRCPLGENRQQHEV
jgi:hypothetical protein